MCKAQGALEYLLVIGGVILVAALVLSIVTGIVSKSEGVASQRVSAALCASYTKAECGFRDPDKSGPLTKDDCVYDEVAKRCFSFKLPPIPQGAVSFISFDSENATHFLDESGNNNHGEKKNGVVSVSGGIRGTKAGKFDGIDDHVKLPSGMTPVNDFSVSMWVKVRDYNPGTGVYFIGPKTGCSPSVQVLTISHSNFKLIFEVGCGSSLQGTTDILKDRWYHVVATVDGGGLTKIYVDGKQEASGNPRGGQTVGSGNDMIGAIFDGGTMKGFLNGFVDEVLVYKRVLSAQEIQDLFKRSP